MHVCLCPSCLTQRFFLLCVWGFCKKDVLPAGHTLADTNTHTQHFWLNVYICVRVYVCVVPVGIATNNLKLLFYLCASVKLYVAVYKSEIINYF